MQLTNSSVSTADEIDPDVRTPAEGLGGWGGDRKNRLTACAHSHTICLLDVCQEKPLKGGSKVVRGLRYKIRRATNGPHAVFHSAAVAKKEPVELRCAEDFGQRLPVVPEIATQRRFQIGVDVERLV
jgi:hypothetical protein